RGTFDRDLPITSSGSDGVQPLRMIARYLGRSSRADRIPEPRLNQLKASLRLDAYFRLNRQPRPQLMIGVFAGQVVEVDADRDALDHLDVVAGRIFRREQAQHRTGGA